MSGVLREFYPLTFTGAHTLEERRDTIRRFRTDEQHKVLIVSLRAGGVGLNLQEASYVFHLDRWWNPAVERQAEDRSHRYGQTVPVHVFKYSCIDTIEERIDRILGLKQDLFDELVDDVSIDLAERLSVDQLFGLFGLENPSGKSG
jgi:non-specific serine/threonine protein kinase